MRYPELSKAYSSRGSAMGRPDHVLGLADGAKFRLYRMSIDSGGYDRGGAYWGLGDSHIGWMYHAYSDGPAGREECFVRAVDRESAKLEVLKTFRKATFYR